MKRISSIKFYLILSIIIAIFLPSFIKYQEFRYKSKKLDDKIRTLKKEINKLEIEKRRLESDITYIEKRAREKIGVVRKGEIVLKEVPAKK